MYKQKVRRKLTAEYKNGNGGRGEGEERWGGGVGGKKEGWKEGEKKVGG